MKLSQLHPNEGQIAGVPANPRQIRDEEFAKLKKSLTNFRKMLELRPMVVDEDFNILGGNMRYRALVQLAKEGAKIGAYQFTDDIPDEWVHQDCTLSEEQKREFVMKDNVERGEWDMDMLANEWDSEEMKKWDIDVAVWESDSDQELQASEDDFDEEKDEIHVRCKKGDIYQLGNHRLMCGDSTSAADVALLMDLQKADIAFTSPPYNLGVSKMLKSKKINHNYCDGRAYNEFSDDLSNEDYGKLLNSALDNAITYSDNAMFNIGILKGSKVGIINMLHEHANQFCDMLYWRKKIAMSLGMPTQIHLVTHFVEPIFCFNKEGNRNFYHSQWKQGCGSDVIESINASSNEYSKEHHATFPVEFAAAVISNFSETSTLDLFGGTGTSMIAAEQLGRKCYMMELDPHYCDVIIARWEKLTGKQAVKIA